MNCEADLRAATTGITAEDELTEDGDKLLLENADNQGSKATWYSVIECR